jgi:hypothetical protein
MQMAGERDQRQAFTSNNDAKRIALKREIALKASKIWGFHATPIYHQI